MELNECVNCDEQVLENDMVKGELYCNDCADELLVTCEDCCEPVLEEDMVEEIHGSMYCEECASESLMMCEDCEEHVHEDASTWIEAEEKIVCEGCIDENYTVTDCCNEHVHHHDVVETEDNNAEYCDNECLYNDGGFICDECGVTYSEDYQGRCSDFETFCQDCDRVSNHIRGYHDNPPVKFFGEASNERYFGVELELDDGNHIDFSEDFNEDTEERIFLMEDGSLSSQGVEIITQPMSLEEHMGGVGGGIWDDVRGYALSNGMRSHDTRTCGLHIHVSRAGVYNNKAEDNMVFITNRFWNRMVKFSRRDIGELNRWAYKTIDKVDEDIKITDVDTSNMRDRYNAINVNNSATIEFRLFKGSLRVETIKASIQLVDLITRVANMYAENEECIDELEWSFITQLAKDDYELLYEEFVRLELV